MQQWMHARVHHTCVAWFSVASYDPFWDKHMLPEWACFAVAKL